MTIAAATLLVSALFNVVAWPRFYPRIAVDPRARDAAGRRTVFYRVHVVLIAVALMLAAAMVVAAIGLVIAG